MPEDNPQKHPSTPINSTGVALLIPVFPVLPVLPVLGIPIALHALAVAAIGGLTFTAASMLLGPSRDKMFKIPELLQGKSSVQPNQEIEAVTSPDLLEDKSSIHPEVLA